jgi:general secretion pathway protein J
LRIRPRPRGGRGFTLVELLVALLVMAVLATLAWQGLDGMLRVRDGSSGSLDRTLRLNTALVQWEQDLQSVVDAGAVPPLQFDGQSLLMTRRSGGGVAVVAWAMRGGRWTRWGGPPHSGVLELQQGWLRAQGLLGNEPGHVNVAEGVDGWQLYKYVGGRKANMQSSGDLDASPAAAPPAAPASAAREALPEAVELRLTIGGRPLTRVIGLGPAGFGS